MQNSKMLQIILHIMTYIEQKSAFNLQILLKSCSIVEKIAYISSINSFQGNGILIIAKSLSDY